ncbi:MAG TPA: helix-turn-helix domain-containing protein [Candidatus Nanoarchaeia archaeon]|nr:helix-turn-helix domain-containing protein [Candidatus Nanoarchaeia archaeon]
MVVDKEVVENIRRMFELNQYEIGIWTHLISRGVSTAGELSDISNVPRSRAYDVLESLEKKGFVVIKIGKPIQYIAVPPSEVVSRFQKRLMIDAEDKVKRLETFKDSDDLNQLTKLYENGIKTYSPTDLSGAFRGSQNIYDQMESMIKNANNNVKIVTTEEGLLNKLNALRNVIKKASERGVKIQVKAPMSERNKDTIESLKPFVDFKNNEEPTARYCVVDDREALLLLLNEDKVHPNYEVGVWLNSETISKVLGKNL